VRDPNREKCVVQAPTNPDKNTDGKNPSLSTPGTKQSCWDYREISMYSPGGKPDPIRESRESIESDDSLHTSLLIKTMALEME
jgi:hypothetical protein